MGKTRPRRPIDPARPETWARYFDSDGKPRKCGWCGAQFVPLVDGQDWCNDCMTGKGRMMELGIVFATTPRRLAWRNDWPDWPKIKHYACMLFNHPMFNAATWDRLETWLTAEHSRSHVEMLMMKPAEVVILLRAAVFPSTNNVGRESGGGGRTDELFPTDEIARLLGHTTSKALLNKLSECRNCGDARRKPPKPVKGTGNRPDSYRWAEIRPWLIREWRDGEIRLPQSAADAKAAASA